MAGLDGGDVDGIVSIHPQEALGTLFDLEISVEEMGGAGENAYM